MQNKERERKEKINTLIKTRKGNPFCYHLFYPKIMKIDDKSNEEFKSISFCDILNVTFSKNIVILLQSIM